MKIIQILGGNEDGGLEKHVIELSKALVDRGLDVTVIAHPQFKNDFQSVNFIPLDLSKSRYNLFILYKLYKILTKESFDLIHSHANKATSMIATLKPFIKIPTIATLHGLKKRLTAFERMDYVITVSNSIGKRLKTVKKQIIYNGISADKYLALSNTRQVKNKTDFQVCTVARLVKVKKIEILIKAFVNIDGKLFIVGDGPEKQSLLELAKKLNIKEKVFFTGSLALKEVSRVLKNSHLFVMTSQNEGFPYTFAEAMFHDLPFVSTPVSDIEKFIGKKYIIPHNSHEELAKKINYIQSNYNTVVNDFKPIFSKAQSVLSVDFMTDETIKVYNKLLKNEG